MLDKILDLLWPRTCAVCRRPVDRPARHVCSDCVMRLPFVPRDGLCRRCGRAATALGGEFLCEDCRTRHPAFDRAASVFRFEGEARELVNAFKFRERLDVRDDFVDFLEATVLTRFKTEEIDVVTAIPSTLSHRLLRGFNPSAFLAEPLAKRLAKPYRDLLRRIGHPKHQSGLCEEERRTNVIGTFKARRGPTGRTVLLIDDVMTTGATLSEAAKTLKEAGWERVWTASMARSIRL